MPEDIRPKLTEKEENMLAFKNLVQEMVVIATDVNDEEGRYIKAIGKEILDFHSTEDINEKSQIQNRLATLLQRSVDCSLEAGKAIGKIRRAEHEYF